MLNDYQIISGSVVAPAGFKASGVFCDIKRLGTGKGSEKGQKPDLALIVSDEPCVCAGMFTTNQVCAAPVKLCIQRMKKGVAQAIVANSGNANACTGEQGMKDAMEMAAEAARLLNIKEENVLVASTGRIGVLMPMENVKKGIRLAAGVLGSSGENADAAATAIMTSDTRQKQFAVEFELYGKKARIGGICKGAGMIHPGMSKNGKRPAAIKGLHATMLCFLTTDAKVSRRALQFALQEAVAGSFNRITVDGDMSTNDTVLILANGKAQNKQIELNSSNPEDKKAFEKFSTMLELVCNELAKMIVKDGEGASRFVTILLTGAKNSVEADLAARAVANSVLVKTSWCGGDPNWGRIMDALGYSHARIVEEKVDIGYSNENQREIIWAVKNGRPTETPFEQLCKVVGEKSFNIHINLNIGKGNAVIYSSDLTEEYVDFNKGNISDPSSLGG
ncbi:MAG: bifunctional glutamate N-acetyltransferase/amino-acid acetyltransferase ArgJ [Verrucomicrobiia bacterium]